MTTGKIKWQGYVKRAQKPTERTPKRWNNMSHKTKWYRIITQSIKQVSIISGVLSPSFTLPPELHRLSDHWWREILIGAQPLLWTVHVRDLGSLWETNTWWSGGEVRRWCQCCGTAANTGYHSQRLECTETIISQLPADSWKPYQGMAADNLAAPGGQL